MPAFHSPHAQQGTPPAKIVTIIKLQAPNSWATAGWEKEAIYSSAYVQQVYDYFNNPRHSKSLASDPHKYKFFMYFANVMDSILNYILDCSNRFDCNTPELLETEYTRVADIVKFYTTQIESYRLETSSPLHFAQNVIIDRFEDFQFKLKSEIIKGELPNISLDTQQALYKAFIENVNGRSLNEIAKNCTGAIAVDCPKPIKINNSTTLSNTSTRTETTTSSPVSITQPLLPEATTSESTILFNVTTENRTLNNSVTTTDEITTPYSNLDSDLSSRFELLSWSDALLCAASGASAATIHIGIERTLVSIQPKLSESNFKRLQYFIFILQAIVNVSALYLTQYSIEAEKKSENNKDEITLPLTLLLCTASHLATGYFGKNNIFTRVLNYSTALVPLLMGSSAILKIIQGFSISLLTYLGSYQFLNFLLAKPLPSAQQKDSSQEIPLVEVKIINPEPARSHSSKSYDSNASTAETDISTDSNQSTIFISLENTYPFLSIAQLQMLQDTVLILIEKIQHTALANRSLKTRDPSSVLGALQFLSETFHAKALQNFIKSVSDKTNYAQNIQKVKDNTRLFNHIQSILNEIKTINNTTHMLPITEIDELLNTIQSLTQVTTNPSMQQKLAPTRAHTNEENIEEVFYLTPVKLAELKKNRVELQKLLGNFSIFKETFLLINEFLDSAELFRASNEAFASDAEMLACTNTTVARSYLSQINNYLGKMSGELFHKGISKETGKTALAYIKFMQNMIDQINKVLECKNVVIETKAKIKKADIEKLITRAAQPSPRAYSFNIFGKAIPSHVEIEVGDEQRINHTV